MRKTLVATQLYFSFRQVTLIENRETKCTYIFAGVVVVIALIVVVVVVVVIVLIVVVVVVVHLRDISGFKLMFYCPTSLPLK